MLSYALLAVTVVVQVGTAYEIKDLSLGITQTIEIKPHSRVELTVNVSTDKSIVVCQVHTHAHNLTLSLERKTSASASVTGTNIGVVSVLHAGDTSAVFYIKSSLNISISALVNTIAYRSIDPLPGGCNLEFNLENDPNFHLSYCATKTWTEFQFADHGRNRSKSPPSMSCEAYSPPLSYDLYVFYLLENDYSSTAYFDGIKKMMNVQDVIKYGRKLKSVRVNKEDIRPTFTIASYTGQGAIYNIVVKDSTTHGETMATYIPVTTYSCNISNKSTCDRYGVSGKVLGIIGGVVGLLLLFLGHQFFKTSTFVIASLACAVIFYIIFTICTSLSLTVILCLSCLCGTVLGSAWLGLWWCFGIAPITVLVTGFTAGYVISSIIFFTPFGNLKYWGTLFNYGMTFTVGVLIVPVLLLYFTKKLNILSCSFIGSYLVTLAVNIFLQAGVGNIVANSLRHSTDSSFITDMVIVTGPVLLPDILLYLLWGILFVTGAAFQFYMDRNKPDFPECPRRVHQSWQERAEIERQPLMSENQPVLYGSSTQVNNGSSEILEDPNA